MQPATATQFPVLPSVPEKMHTVLSCVDFIDALYISKRSYSHLCLKKADAIILEARDHEHLGV